MKTSVRFLLVCLLASPAWGQDSVSDRPTGLDRLPPGYQLGSGERGTPHGEGIDPAKLQEYLAAVEAVDLAAEYQTGGNARKALEVDRIHVEASWSRAANPRRIGGGRSGDTSPTLDSLTVTPLASWASAIRNLPAGPGRHTVSLPGAGRFTATGVKHRRDGYIELEVPGRNYIVDTRGRWKRGRKWNGRIQRIGNKINKVTINRQGHLHIDVDGAPNVNVKKVTRDRNGDLRLHVGNILIPDIVISKRTGKATMDFGLFGEKDLGNLKMLTEFKNWPPTLADLANMKFDGGSSETAFDGSISYNLQARGRQGRQVEVGGVRGEFGRVNISGVAALDKDGFRILGDRSALDLELRVGGRLSMDQVSTSSTSGTLRLQGKYGLRVPTNGGQMDFTLNGRVTFDLQGNTVKINVPNGPQIDARHAHVSGGAGFRFTQGSDGSRLNIVDGVYRLELDGPIKIKKLNAGPVEINGVELDGSGDPITSQGRVNLSANGMQVDGNLSGNGDVVNQDGLIRVVQGDVTVEGRPTGGNFNLDVEELSITSPLRRGERATITTRGRGTGSGVTVEDLRVDAPAGQVEAERVRLDFELGVAAAEGRIESGTGSATATLEGEALVSGTTETAATPYTRRGTVNVTAGGKLNFRDAASTDHGVILGQLTRGDKVDILSNRGVWRQVRLADGREGFVHGKYLDEVARPARPGGQTEWALALSEGTRAEINIDESSTDGTRSQIAGRISTTLKFSSADLKTAGGLEMRILGAAQASVSDVAFRWENDRSVNNPNKIHVDQRIEVPFEVALTTGSRLKSTSNEIVIDREGSTIKGKAIVVLSREGSKIESIEEVDARIVSTGITRFGGEIVQLNGTKTLIVKGRMVLKSNGLDIYGEVGLTVRGDEHTPVLSVNW